MEDILILMLQIQTSYIEALNFLEAKNYFLALQKLQLAKDLYNSCISLTKPEKPVTSELEEQLRTIIALYDKINTLITEIDNYLTKPDAIDNVTLSPEELTADTTDFSSTLFAPPCSNAQSEQFELQVSEELTAIDIFVSYYEDLKLTLTSCFLPIQRRVSSQFFAKFKRD